MSTPREALDESGGPTCSVAGQGELRNGSIDGVRVDRRAPVVTLAFPVAGKRRARDGVNEAEA